MMDDERFLTADHWNRVGVRHHHGICLPVSSLVSKKSCGIGEFLDLIPLIQWLPSTGFNVIQVLPLNDTGTEPSPYMALSANALHPIYLSLRALPLATTVPGFLSLVKKLTPLNETPRVCFNEVYHKKQEALVLYLKHRLDAIIEEPSYIEFAKINRSWLTPYSIYRALKEHQHGKAWWDWNPACTPHLMEEKLYREILSWRVIQYLCFSQFEQVRLAADSCGVLLEGDVPILINKDSADVWHHPELFSLSLDVGAPPDMYNPKGQHWGFPLYQWKAHQKNGFAWWKERLHVQERLYHMYRLDHLVGFFRLYGIPPGKKPTCGAFIPKTSAQWKKLGEMLLTVIVEATSMLPLAEDLGDVPDLVRRSIHELGIPGLKVLRWERRWHGDGSFLRPESFSPESVTTVSTHDTSTLAGWWEEEPLVCQQMAKDYGLTWSPHLTPALQQAILAKSHASGSLFHINLLNEYLSLFPELSWGDPEHERINRPGTVGPLNWTYRTKISVEEIVNHAGLQQTMSDVTRVAH